eukprot:3782228-Pyramimonas_sp.AAC.1
MMLMTMRRRKRRRRRRRRRSRRRSRRGKRKAVTRGTFSASLVVELAWNKFEPIRVRRGLL